MEWSEVKGEVKGGGEGGWEGGGEGRVVVTSAPATTTGPVH